MAGANAGETTATELALDEGITKQAVHKLVKKFTDAGLLTTRRAGREVLFDRRRFLALRAAHRDPGRAHLLHTPMDTGLSAPAPPPAAQDANAVRTPGHAPAADMPATLAPPEATASLDLTAATEAASRTQAAKAEAAEAAAARQKFQLAKELGQYIEKSAVEVQVQRLLVPLRALMIDGAPDLSRQLQGIEDERQRTQIIRAFFRDGLNTFAEKLREPNVGDSDPDHAGGPAGDG